MGASISSHSQSRFYFNGVRLPDEVPSSKATFDLPQAKDNIAAIDFGTTSCSVAFYQRGMPEPLLLKLDGHSDRIPTAILIDSSGRILEFGRKALKKYARSSKEDKAHLHYFHQIKMDLHHDELVDRNYTIRDSSKLNEFFLVEIIALILKYLKEKMLEYSGRGIRGRLNATDYDWVITVPAIWKAKGKQMMREAAYRAGLTTDDQSFIISSITSVKKELKPIYNPPNPHQISLVLEPEVAALHCKDVAKKLDERFADPQYYMVLDIGGGTVDITVHERIDKDFVRVILPPMGNEWGGTRVNAEFRKFLGKLVDDADFDSFLQPDKSKSIILDEIVNEEFEEQKIDFGDNPRAEVSVKLPYKFMLTYSDRLEAGVDMMGDDLVTLIDDDTLCMTPKKMEELFKPVVENLTDVFTNAMKELEQKGYSEIDAVFLVGGLGGCKYIYQVIKDCVTHHFYRQVKSANSVFRTDDHLHAVVRGSILYKQNPLCVTSRIADATYGTKCVWKFNGNKHGDAYRFRDDDDNYMCKHLFSPFILKGDELHCNKLLQVQFAPIKHKQETMTFPIFTSQDKPEYALTPDGEPIDGIDCIGNITIQMPIPNRDKSRRVILTIDFSRTEIHIEAHDIDSGEKIATTIDFLASGSINP